MQKEPTPTPTPTPIKESTPTMEERARTQLTACEEIRAKLREQMVGIENQIYCLHQLLNPEATDAPPQTPEGPETPDGTI